MKEAKENNEYFRSAYNHRFNSGRKKFPFKQGDLVLLHSPLQALRRDRRERVEGLNPKLSRPWCGPCRILKVWDETPGVLIEFSLSSGIKGKFKVHQDRLKEYFLSRGECDPFLHPIKHKALTTKLFRNGKLNNLVVKKQKLVKKKGMKKSKPEGQGDVAQMSNLIIR